MTSADSKSEILQSQAGIDILESRWLGILPPPPRLNCREWSDEFRYLSKEANAKGGKYRSAFAPYQRAPMEDVNDQQVQSTCLMWASQVGKTETVNNITGYFIAADPSPILVVQPTVEFAESWSKERLVPMLRDTPALRGLVKDARSRDSGNTILHKSYPGGNIAVVGANAPAGLAGRPRRVVLLDEIDRYPASAGTEGDPCLLAERRTEGFWNAVIFKTSTPTLKGASRIEAEFEQTDKRYWFCPCPKCGNFQTLKWAQVQWPDGKPEEAFYECENQTCRAHWTDEERVKAVRAGEWRATAPFKGKRGYHLNGIYSPFKAKRGFRNRLHQMAAQFLEAKASGREGLKTWVNTFLAETWSEVGEQLEASALMKRREDYGPEVPNGALLLTLSVDAQGDRLEAEVTGWGPGEESWGIQYAILPGNPLQDGVWKDLDEFRKRTWKRADGLEMRIVTVCVDSSFFTEDVLAYCKPRFAERVYAVRGSNQAGQPIAAGPFRNNRKRCPVYRVGTDTAKGMIYGRLKLEEAGPGYMHYPRGDFGFDEAYFSMLTAEEIRTEYRRGFPVRVWHKTRARNEALDIRVYAQAAIVILQPDWKGLTKNLASKVRTNTLKRDDTAESDKNEPTKQLPEGVRHPARPHRPGPKRGGWVNKWKL